MFLGWTALAGAAGALSAAAFLARWFSDAMDAKGAAAQMTWPAFAPAGFVLTEALTALAIGLLAVMSLVHLRAGWRWRSYALAVILVGVRGGAVALMLDSRFRAGWESQLGDAWAKLVVGFAVAQVALLTMLFAQIAIGVRADATARRHIR
jgi:hypothetical protein